MPRFDDDDDRPRKRRPADDDDPPPRRRRRPADDVEADDDHPPRRRKARSEGIQEGPPRRRRPPADEEIEEGDRPRKRRRKKGEDDESAKPKKKKRVRPEDDEVLRKYLRRDSKKHSWDFTPMEEFFIDTPALYFYWIPWIAVVIFIAFAFIGVLPPSFMLGFCIFMCALGVAAALVGFFTCKKIYPIGRAMVLGVQGGVIFVLGYVLYKVGTMYDMFD